MRFSQALRLASLVLVHGVSICVASTANAQAPVPNAPQPPASKPLNVRPAQTPAEAAEALRISKLAIINGKPYDQPSVKDTLIDYAKDTYGVPALLRISVRTLYAEARGTPSQWALPERFGSQVGINVINGNVRLGMELLFKEDLRYLPCHGCTAKKKLANALLAEITARHDEDGHRFFTLTPTIADFSGPIIAHSIWYPSFDPWAGVVSTRLVFATRIGQHLFQEFVWERRHHDPPYDGDPKPPSAAAAVPPGEL